ncbi:MAG TPA: transposase [Anaerolineales bacterium]|nr:transposase [Anaerolineales bacterium]
MAEGDSTQRSRLDADNVTQVLRQQGVANLRAEAELALVLDGMELRRPGAHEQEYLMSVKALDGSLVNGYRSFNVLGMGQETRGLLYHKLFSSNLPDFQSENVEIKAAIEHTEQALIDFEGAKTWVIDMGFDNDDVWWQIWQHPRSHLVNRVYHLERIVEWQTASGQWEERYLDATFQYLQHLTTIETQLEVRLQGQKYAKRQTVSVELSAVPIRVYHPQEKSQTKPVWLVRAKIVGAVGKPWYLLTDWAVTDAESAVRIFRFYRRRWAVEDTFKFIKTSFGIEEVQMLSFAAVRRLVAYGWVAAGFLFHLGLTLDQEEVRLLAYLGGWEVRKNRPPGKQVLTRGLRRLIDQATTETILRNHIAEQGDLPPFIKRFLAAYGYKLEH